MLDIDKIMEGFSLTTSPATNAGDPMSGKKPETIKSNIDLDDETETESEEKKLYDELSIESESLEISEEEEKELDDYLDYYKSEEEEFNIDNILSL